MSRHSGIGPVVDAVTHTYNFHPSNYALPLHSARFAEGAYMKHRALSPEDHWLSREQFLNDFAPEALAHALFAESDVALAVFHSVPLHDFFHDGLVSMENGRLLKERYPERFLWYGAVNMMDGPAKAMESIEYQARELGVDGFKFYPATFVDGRTRTWSMDDETAAFPLFEEARKLGIVHIAVHKAIPLGPTVTAPYRVDDVEHAASLFPDLSFEIVHAGAAFVEQTARMLGRFPNVYANLELTFGYLISRPRVFAHVLGELLYWGSADQVLFASGCNLLHPQPLIRAFRGFQMPEELRKGYGYPGVSEHDKALILGGNALRLHGLDEADLPDRIPNGLDRGSGASETPPWQAVPGPVVGGEEAGAR